MTFFKDGQEFLVDEWGYWNMLNGKMCAYAWTSINQYVYAALQGGSLLRDWTKDKKVMIAGCNDGV